MDKRLEWMSAVGIVPSVTIVDAEKAVPLARALDKGGIPIAEIAIETSAAVDSIRRISGENPEFLIGAGNVSTIRQVDSVLEAGGQFISVPEFQPDLIRYALSRDLLVIPGISFPEEIESVTAMGLNAAEFFPDVERELLPNSSGLLKWLPMGLTDAAEMNGYLSCNRILACGNAWIARRELIRDENWDGISALCKDAVRGMLGFRVVHVGMNCRDAAEAEQIARRFCLLFDVPYLPNETAIFAGSLAECIKGPYLGTHGHIAIGVNDVDRAVYQLKRRGAAFDEKSRKVDSAGDTTLIYLKEEIGGFALHLVRNKA